MSVSQDKNKVLQFIEERRERLSGGDESARTHVRTIPFDPKDYQPICQDRSDFYWTLKHLEHGGLIEKIDLGDTDDYFRLEEEGEWIGEFVVNLPEDFDRRLRAYRSPQNANTAEPIDGDIDLYISRAYGIYDNSTTKTPAYHIEGRRANLVWFFRDEPIARGKRIIDRLEFGTPQRLSDEIANINGLLTTTLGINIKNKLIVNISKSGYCLNRQVYNFHFMTD